MSNLSTHSHFGDEFAASLGDDFDLKTALADHHRWLLLGAVFYVYYAAYVATAIRNWILHLPPPALFSGSDLLAGAWLVGLVIVAIVLGAIEASFAGRAVARKHYERLRSARVLPPRCRTERGFAVGLFLCGLSILLYPYAAWTGTLVLGIGSLAALFGAIAILWTEGLWGRRYAILLPQVWIAVALLWGRWTEGSVTYALIGLFIALTFYWWAVELAAARGLTRNERWRDRERDAQQLLGEMRGNALNVLVGYLLVVPVLSAMLIGIHVRRADPIWGQWARIERSDRLVEVARTHVGKSPGIGPGPRPPWGEERLAELWFFGVWNGNSLAVERSSGDIVILRFEPEPDHSWP